MGFPNPLVTLTPVQVNQIIAAVPSAAANGTAAANAILPSVPTPAQIVGAPAVANVPTPTVVGQQVNSNVKTRHALTLLSGTGWLVPAGVLYVNATLIAGGGAVAAGTGFPGNHGQKVTSSFATTPGTTVPYAIGAGGTSNGAGGNTTMTGATTALGGAPGSNGTANAGDLANNGALGNGTTANGGAGAIELEWWV